MALLYPKLSHPFHAVALATEAFGSKAFLGAEFVG